tara:strand:+ start:323 stop:457 length:135 start_codon:yes stop_codon:yes gene_type:complete
LIISDGDFLIGIILSGFTYYFRGLGTWRIIDKDVKLFNVEDEEE